MSSQARDFSNPVSANLRAKMDEHGLKTREVAEMTGVSARQVNRWRNGQEARYQFVLRLADAFGCDPRDFYVEESAT